MRFAAVALLVVACAVACFAATRPVVPEIFSAGTDVVLTLHRENKTVIHAKGVWAVDQPAGRANEFYNVVEQSHQHFNYRRLDRYDLHRTYELVDAHNCHVRNENGSMPAVWDWLKVASFAGVHRIHDKQYDLWQFHAGYARIALAVTTEEPNRPQYLFVDSPERNVSIRFVSFNTAKPAEALFNVPKQCGREQNVADLGCVDRNTMIARGQNWVNNRVPYNEGGRYQGYRTDCSGFVSMCWGTAQPGYSVNGLIPLSHPIDKNSLAPGDVLLCAGEHIVLFAGWADSSRSHYVSMEETRPGEGTVKRVTPYPYWYQTGCFRPYRYNQVC